MNHGIKGCGHLQGEKQQPLSQIRVPLGNTYYSSVRNCINMQCYCFKNVSLNEHIHGTFDNARILAHFRIPALT